MDLPNFYDENPPRRLQQGDLLQGIPLIICPETDQLAVIRTPSRGEIALIRQEPIAVFDELVLGDRAFENEIEFVAVRAERGLVAIVTQTCDLDNESRDAWLVAPVRLLAEHQSINQKELERFKYSALFPLPAHPNDYYEVGFIDLGDIRQINKAVAGLSDRIAAMATEVQREFGDHIARFFGRVWDTRPATRFRRAGGTAACGIPTYTGTLLLLRM